MSTDMHRVHSDGPDGGSDEQWQRMWSHREQLLKVARRRSMSVEDAEDAVHEAMVRAVENRHVDGDRLGAWLTTVTMRLCVDRYRQVNREAEVRSRSTPAPGPVPVDEVVCDRAEAKWLARQSVELPARQAEALRLKSEDLDVGQVAREMGLSYQAVESLLARARRTLRNSLAGTLAAAVWVWGRRPRTGGSAQAVALVSTTATLAVLGLALPYGGDADSPATSRSVPSRTVGSATPEHDEAIPPASAPPSAERDAGRPTGPADAPSGAASIWPDVQLPTLPAPPALRVPPVSSVPSVPSVPPIPRVASVLPHLPPSRVPLVPPRPR
ncbi:sigma-70 family RNA polymerase sigma factor [Streptomyces sp. SID13588]|uniref:RNA polymerase sigma factor n=1 Tax=Streptomyces sp. SID13588 TaxID=2706051 RepID=UPI0013C5498A|nr:sigma-70 family RNA polymerase sigma factor [Streptomyces sp. SID13588]NEA76190.1 sigma-70 family RNA polymerase sigma factor [Streptomyces sp. SID13588]